MSKLRNYITKKPAVFVAECSAKISGYCEDESELAAKTLAAAEREMREAGWLDNFIIEDTENIACPACVKYCKENATDFEELDTRAGGTAK